MDFKKEYDTIVIGAGPSGVKAALKCSKKGQKVLIIDSNQNSGGQIYRAPPKSYVKKSDKSLEENLIQIKFSKHLEENNIDIQNEIYQNIKDLLREDYYYNELDPHAPLKLET